LKQGKVLFQGPVSTLADHFASMGYECPQNYNPADYVMFISQTESTEELTKRGMFESATKSLAIEDSQTASSSDTAATTPPEAFQVVIKSTFFTQLKWLMNREFLNTIRNKPALIGRFGVTIVLNTIFGLIFFDVGNSDNSNQDEINSHFGALTMVMISAMFGSGQPTLLEFPSERPMFMREYSTGTYSVVTYSISKLTMEIPILFVQGVVQFAIVYNMMSLQGNFILLVLAAFGTGAASSSLAVLLGCLVTDVKQVRKNYGKRGERGNKCVYMCVFIDGKYNQHLISIVLFIFIFLILNRLPKWLPFCLFLKSYSLDFSFALI
jgi:hypothetical protein